MSTRIIYSAKVARIIDHTPTVRELFLSVESEGFAFRAGQFISLHVPGSTPEAKPTLRAYSIASGDQSPRDLRFLFKHVTGGIASTYVWKLGEGDHVRFTGPFGRVFFVEPPSEQVVFLNTGTGVSQHVSYLLSKGKAYPQVKFKMLFGVRTEADVYFQADLEKLSKELPNFSYEFVLSRPSDSWKGKRGHVQSFIEEFDYLKIPTTFYLCGNGAMIKETKAYLVEGKGFDKNRILVEAFD